MNVKIPLTPLGAPAKFSQFTGLIPIFIQRVPTPLCLLDGCHIELEFCDTPGNLSHFTAKAVCLYSLLTQLGFAVSGRFRFGLSAGRLASYLSLRQATCDHGVAQKI